jgi:hypothetical protein
VHHVPANSICAVRLQCRLTQFAGMRVHSWGHGGSRGCFFGFLSLADMSVFVVGCRCALVGWHRDPVHVFSGRWNTTCTPNNCKRRIGKTRQTWAKSTFGVCPGHVDFAPAATAPSQGADRSRVAACVHCIALKCAPFNGRQRRGGMQGTHTNRPSFEKDNTQTRSARVLTREAPLRLGVEQRLTWKWFTHR